MHILHLRPASTSFTLKRLLLSLLRGFSQFLSRSPRTFLLFKDEAVGSPAEHLYRMTALIRREVRVVEGMAIVDIGAAFGDTACYFARHFPGTTIRAFEPFPESHEQAFSNTRRFANVELVNKAIHDRMGRMSFHVSSNYLSSSLLRFGKESLDPPAGFEHRKIIEVEVITLDEAVRDLRDILLIKLDTQGTEATILRHGKEALQRTRYVLVEMNNHRQYESTGQYYEVDQILRENGFSLTDLIVSYRNKGHVTEYDAIYSNLAFRADRGK